jgi:hypothetical protein
LITTLHKERLPLGIYTYVELHDQPAARGGNVASAVDYSQLDAVWADLPNTRARILTLVNETIKPGKASVGSENTGSPMAS